MNRQDVPARMAESDRLWKSITPDMSIAEKASIRKRAHPWHPCASSGGALRISVSICGKYIYISDTYEFISIIDIGEQHMLGQLVQMEAKQKGSVAMYLLGKSALQEAEAKQAAYHAEHVTKLQKERARTTKQKGQHANLSLADLGL